MPRCGKAGTLTGPRLASTSRSTRWICGSKRTRCGVPCRRIVSLRCGSALPPAWASRWKVASSTTTALSRRSARVRQISLTPFPSSTRPVNRRWISIERLRRQCSALMMRSSRGAIRSISCTSAPTMNSGTCSRSASATISAGSLRMYGRGRTTSPAAPDSAMRATRRSWASGSSLIGSPVVNMRSPARGWTSGVSIRRTHSTGWSSPSAPAISLASARIERIASRTVGRGSVSVAGTDAFFAMLRA